MVDIFLAVVDIVTHYSLIATGCFLGGVCLARAAMTAKGLFDSIPWGRRAADGDWLLLHGGYSLDEECAGESAYLTSSMVAAMAVSAHFFFWLPWYITTLVVRLHASL